MGTGTFDFGQFQQIFDYILGKIQAGGALTPEEKQVYDMLLGFASQGLNLTNTADFNSLYTAFNALADDATKAQFEKLYGTNLFQDPNSGVISFTKPGTLVTQLMKQGLSINDGPVMALLAEGLKDYTKQIAQNKFASMTNSYAAMTPIRAQNIQAATNAGQIGTAAGNRLVSMAGPAVSGGAAAGAGEGPGITVDTSGGGAGSGGMDWLKYLLPSLLGLGGSILVGGLGQGWLSKLFNKNPNDPNAPDYDPNATLKAPGDDASWLANAQAGPSLTPNEWMNAQTYGSSYNPFSSGLVGWGGQNALADPSMGSASGGTLSSAYPLYQIPPTTNLYDYGQGSSSYYDPTQYGGGYSYWDPSASGTSSGYYDPSVYSYAPYDPSSSYSYYSDPSAGSSYSYYDPSGYSY